MKKAKQGAVRSEEKSVMQQIAKHWEFYYVLLLPGIILTIIFK